VVALTAVVSLGFLNRTPKACAGFGIIENEWRKFMREEVMPSSW